MSVVVNTTRLRSRLTKLIANLPALASAATVAGAIEMRRNIQDAIRAQWVRENQIGFDLDHFLKIIEEIESIPGGGVGILNVEKMGTAQDLERIAHVKGLYHQKTRQGEKFGLFINHMGMFFDQVQELIESRQARWNGTEPQWWLIEHGTLGVPGAWNPQPPANTITTTAINAQPWVWGEIRTAIDNMLRIRGII